MITFYTKALGSSHFAANKPCQDNGTHYNKDGVYIAVVCDGHGGESYVRSDKGSHIAAEIAKNQILKFVESTPKELFEGKKNAVTVVPTRDPRIDKQGIKRDISMLSESETELLRQNILYTKEIELYPEIEESFRALFKSIYVSWKSEIEKDFQMNPFSKKEKEKFGSARIEKAYGTTLMAAVRTPDYWFAFHIGDGKLYACDKLMRWSEPVPWDCNCFLNFTTSLCDYNPVDEFRYAFDGTGNFPLAFALGSDGIDDTFINPKLIHKFYSQLLCAFNEREQEEAEVLLKEHLSSLSERGSHDDMSVAAIIDKENLPKAIEYYKIISEVRMLSAEREKRREEINKLTEKIDLAQEEIKNKENRQEESFKQRDAWMQEVSKQEKSYSEQIQKLTEELEASKDNFLKCQKEKDDYEVDFSTWEDESRKRVEELKQFAEAIEAEVFKEPIAIVSECDNTEDNSNPHNYQSNTDSSLKSSHISNAQADVSDTPNEVYKKANDSIMSEEGIVQMNKEADAQAEEILNNHHS